jgi:FRG domain
MHGQWTGLYTGTNTGGLVLDLDADDTGYAGEVFVYDTNPGLPRTFARNAFPKDQSRVSQQVPLFHVERGSGSILTPEILSQRFPGVQMPTYTNTEWEISPKEIDFKWTTDIDTGGEGKLYKSEEANPSKLAALEDVKSWETFQKFALALEPNRFVFRGHENSTWRLRTSFHRTGRASLMKFAAQDIPALHRHLSGLTTHRFDLGDPLDHASFLHLAQHHGYPTPILDWTHSPFVAAYFAFKDLRRDKLAVEQRVRILVLDARGWGNDLEKGMFLQPGFLHMTLLEPLATNNPRALPQQSISTVTNIDDIEQYVRDAEARSKKRYLRAIDIPASERRSVMQDLALMGITAGSLFPGIDGACLQLKERFFDL